MCIILSLLYCTLQAVRQMEELVCLDMNVALTVAFGQSVRLDS